MALDHLTGTLSVNWAEVRRFKRYTVDFRLKVSQFKEGAKAVIYGQGSDVSEGGIAAYIPAEIVKGDVVTLEMVLPYSAKKELLQLRATVRNRNGFRFGLEFLPMNEPVHAALVRSLNALALVE